MKYEGPITGRGPASVDYVQSRGTDLITNGSGTLGNNYNFSTWTFTATDAPTGAAGSFLCTANAAYGIYLDEYMPVDPSKKLLYAFKARQTSTSDVALMYGMLVPYDAFKNAIMPYHYAYIAGTKTSLAVDLNPGDLTVTLTDSTNWYGSAGKPAAASTHFRSFIWWDYVDAGGKVWPADTYSRSGWAADSWLDGAVVGNVITLRVPYAGAARPAGTELSNGTSGGNYMYGGISGTAPPKVWTAYSASVTGLAPAGGVASMAVGWPPGVGYARAGFLVNYTTPANSRQAVAAVSLSDASAAILRANHTGTQLAATISDFAAAAVAAAAGAASTTLSTEDLDTRTTPGKYHQPSTANATALRHYPIVCAGLLEVSSGYTYQRYTTYNGGLDRVFVRGYYISSWGVWTELAKTTHTHAGAPELTGRLGPVATTITDWNNAVENGWYMAYSAANAPSPYWYIGRVEAHQSNYVTQTAHVFDTDSAADTKSWRRSCKAGVWSAWYRLMLSQAELDTRYVPLAQKGAVDGVATLDETSKIPVAQMPTSVPLATAAWSAVEQSAVDNRNVATTPADYYAYAKWFFKACTVIGVPSSSNYCSLYGFRAYIDSSGDVAHEYAYTTDGAVYHRYGRDTWGAWFKVSGDNVDNVFADDTRLDDARDPLAHAHATTDVTGFDAAADARVVAGIGGKSDTDHTHDADTIADGIANKAYTAAEKSKLAGIDVSADVNLVVGQAPGTVASGDDNRFFTGALTIARGGTAGTATPTTWGVTYGTGTTIAYTAAGTTGQLLSANTGAAPTWKTLIGAVSGVASLDTNAKVPLIQIPTGVTSTTVSLGNHGHTADAIIDGTANKAYTTIDHDKVAALKDNTPFEGVSLYSYGHSFTIFPNPYTTQASGEYMERVRKRLGMGVGYFRGRSSTPLQDTIGGMLNQAWLPMAGQSGRREWVPGSRGIVLFQNYMNECSGTDGTGAPYRLGWKHALRTAFALIGSKSKITSSSATRVGTWSQLSYYTERFSGGDVWFSSVVGNTISFAIPEGDTCWVVGCVSDASYNSGSWTAKVNGVTLGGSSPAVQGEMGSFVSAPDAAFTVAYGPAAFKITGMNAAGGTGAKTLVLTTTEAKPTFFNCVLMPLADPPHIFYGQEPLRAYSNGTFLANRQYFIDMAAAGVAEFPNAHIVELEGDPTANPPRGVLPQWNNATMVGKLDVNYLFHPGDRGMIHIADKFEAAIRAAITVPTDGVMTF